MATRGQHAPFRLKRRGKRWDRPCRLRLDYFATDEDEDSIITGPGDERESGAAGPRG
jgi:hypothetical protein